MEKISDGKKCFKLLLENKELLAGVLKNQEYLVENNLFNPYEYFGIVSLSEKPIIPIFSQYPDFRKKKLHFKSLISTSFQSDKNSFLINNSFAKTPKPNKTPHYTEKCKPFHLKIDLNAGFSKKITNSLEIPSSRSASKLSINKPAVLTISNKKPKSEKKNEFFSVKKLLQNEKQKTFVSFHKSFVGNNEKKEKKTMVLKENNGVQKIWKGIESKYQNTYLNFLKVDKKKN